MVHPRMPETVGTEVLAPAPVAVGPDDDGSAVPQEGRARSWVAWLTWGSDPDGIGVPGPAIRFRVGLGVLAVVLFFLTAGTLHAFATRPFAPPDETSHVAYALALSEGRIPLITDFPDAFPIPGMRQGLSIWTANHPPGTYALMAVPLRVGVETANPVAGFYAARLLNVLAAGLAVLFVARIAALIVPHRPRVIVGGTALAGLWPYSIQTAGSAYTDGLALGMTMALVLAAVTVLVRGPSRRMLVILALLAALGGLARAATAVMVVLAGVAWGVACLLQSTENLRRRLARGVAGGLAIGMSAALAAGWFYIENTRIYGDPTGSAALFELHNREPRAEFFDILFRAHDYRFHLYQLWNRYEGVGQIEDPLMDFTLEALYQGATVILIAVVTVLLHRLARTNRHTARLVRAPAARLDAGRVAAWVLLVVWWGALFAMMIKFVSDGGSPHARYVWSGMAGFGLVLALGADAIRTPRLQTRRDSDPDRRVLPSVSVGLLLTVGALQWGNAVSWTRFLRAIGVPTTDLVDASVTAVAGTGIIPAPGWTALVLLMTCLAGAALIMWSLVILPAHTHVPASDAGADLRKAADERAQTQGQLPA